MLGPVTIIEHAPAASPSSANSTWPPRRGCTSSTTSTGRLLLDLHGVTFLDSSGIAGLMRLYRRCEHDGCTLRIEAWSDRVERVLRIVGLHEILTGDGVGHGPDRPPPPPTVETGAAASD